MNKVTWIACEEEEKERRERRKKPRVGSKLRDQSHQPVWRD
jgi:hypothetical protein